MTGVPLPPSLSMSQLGNSANWKVCSSRLCSTKGAPSHNHADAPEQCVFGGYRAGNKLNPDFDDSLLCKKSGTCTGGTCVGKALLLGCMHGLTAQLHPAHSLTLL
jgi:hypothetical protein